MPKIKKITCHKALNSRASWTINTRVELEDGSYAEHTIPDGASKGLNEANYLSVEKAIDVVSSAINEALQGIESFDQGLVDEIMLRMDGTSNKSHLGGNSILSVSIANAKAAAISKGQPLYRYLNEIFRGNNQISFPTPVFNVLNGGLHAHNNLSFQEFMVIPSQTYNIDEALEVGTKIYQSLKKLLLEKGYDVDVGDEGGFAPNNLTVEKALNLIKEAASIEFEPGKDIFFGMDVAAGSFYKKHNYEISEENKILSEKELHKFYEHLVSKFEIMYLEDPFFESNFEPWIRFNKEMGGRLLVVADDLAVTNPSLLKKVIEKDMANSVIVKPNQVGSLTETLEFIHMAQKSKMAVIVSHRSGDTAEDTFIADLGVAVGAEFIKSGAPARGERVAKYNRLLEIFSELNS